MRKRSLARAVATIRAASPLVDRQRLLAQHVLARLEVQARVGAVPGVRGGHVDHVDLGVAANAS